MVFQTSRNRLAKKRRAKKFCFMPGEDDRSGVKGIAINETLFAWLALVKKQQFNRRSSKARANTAANTVHTYRYSSTV
jgi:hypothetical protein